MSLLTSRKLDNTSYAFVSKRHMNRQHKVRVIGYIWKISEDILIG